MSHLFDDAKAMVRAFLGTTGIEDAARNAFGVSAGALQAAIRTFDRDGWPKLVLLDEQDLHGARGAYDRAHDTIYLSRALVAAGDTSAITAVLVEEIGHAIDARVHRVDAAGDEGAIFADYVLGHPPSSGELAALKSENDLTTITVNGKSVLVEVAAPVVGSITLDGMLTDWTVNDQIDRSLSTSGYDLYAKSTGGSFVFAIKAPEPVGADTTVWLNTDQNASTGFQIWDFAGGAEYNINFDAAGVPHLYRGDAGQTLVATPISFGYSADHKVVEFSVATSALGSPGAINTLWDVNDNTYLPSDYSATQYAVLNSTTTLPQRTDFAKKVGIVFSDSSASQYWNQTAYSQLFMNAQNQATMAGVRYDVLTEADLTSLAKLVNYDALVFPGFANVKAADAAKIEANLKIASQQYHIGLIAAGEFMVYDASGNALAGDPYARMKTLLDMQFVGGGFPANITVNAGDITHPMMSDYVSRELIHNYSGEGWLAFAPVDVSGTQVLATQTIGTQTFDAVVATNTGGRNVHFSTDGVMADNNLLWQAIDYAVNGSGISAGIQLSRNKSIVASRVDMDQAMEMLDVSPASGAGIYDKLLPLLQQWKSAYNYVGSYYVDIGNDPAGDQATNWAKSGAYYKQLIAMGNELGSHSLTHPEDTNTLTAAQFQSEFQGSKQIIEQQMSQILGRPFVVDGAAVPGAPESLATALSIIQYYNYLSGGFTGVGAGFPGAIGYLNPAMAAANKVYIAPNVEFDFSLIEFKGMTPAQATAEWNREIAELTSHSDVPVLVWPWHDYAAAVWATNPPAPSPYTAAMFTNFIAQAYNAGAEFVTLDDLAERISSFHTSGVTTSISGSTVTAKVTSADAGQFALDLDNIGTQKIASVTNWYAYDDDSVFLPRTGGTFTINLGASAIDVTHIIALPMRADLISVSGNGTTLGFSLLGEGNVVVDLKSASTIAYTVAGATIVSVAGDRLELNVGAYGPHDVAINLYQTNTAPTITSNGAGASAALTISENATAVTTVTSTDPDVGHTRSYSLSGADAAQFTINTTSGALAFLNAPDFEAPRDQGGNNVYDLTVTARDSKGLTDTQALAITVQNVGGLTLTGTSVANTLTGAGEEDTISGLGANDVLAGLGGNDKLLGGDGNDVLTGGAGADTLTGGLGSDRFDFNAMSDARDTITDFARGVSGDKLDVKDLLVGFTAGTSNVNAFVQLSGTTSTTVSVNADGIGSDFVQMAVLQNVAMSATLLNELVANGNLVLA